ncbi:MAG TPA: FG-GAP-like repeat-containing protein [Saprospiraceae bacterium]|nr:FG-GAP-like repeat-containing protein [Saprospiraceae bacterium]
MKNSILPIILLTLLVFHLNSQWNQVVSPTTSTINSLQFVNTNSGYISGNLGGNVIKTTDGGTSWIFTVTGSSSTFYDIYFENAITGFVAGSTKQVIKTTNSGSNWDIKTSGSGTIYSMSFPTSITGYVVGGSPTVINKSTDSGSNWVSITPPTSNTLRGVYFVDNNTGWISGASGTLWKTTDGCNSWIPQTQSSSINFEKVIFVNSNSGFVIGSNGTILRTTNSGLNWLQQSSGVTANLNDISYLSPNLLWAVGSGKIIKSTDLGVTWGSQNNPSPSAVFNSISMIDANTGYIGGSNGILLKTTNGGGPFVVPCFAKITSGSIVNDNGYGQGNAWADYDNDGDLDVVVTSYNDGCQSCTYPIYLYRNDGGSFTRIMTGPIAAEMTRGFGCSWGDYDNDGRLDLFVSTGGQNPLNNLLFHNEGNGNFTKVTSGSIVNDPGSSSGSAWLDYDKDGWLDLFVVNGSNQNDFLYRNNGNGTFTKVTSGSIVNDGAFGRGCAVGDYNNDGWPDLFVACYSGQNDLLYRNNGNGTFTLTSGVIPSDNANGSGGTFGDYDNDGWLDLFVTNNSANNRLYRNNGNGTFTIANFSLPNNETGSNSFGSSWFDYDNDGRLDLYVVNWGLNFLYKNNGNGNFTRITDEVIAENSYGISASHTDINLDGKLEVFCANNGPNGNPQNDLLYQLNCTVGNYIGIKLKGCNINKSGIGARVTIKTGGNAYIRELTGGQGCLSQNMMFQHFGIGSATVIDSVIVHWTTGNIQKLANVNANQYILVDECLVGLISNNSEIPTSFSLKQNFPNPFNPTSNIIFDLPTVSDVSLKLYDNSGKEVITLINDRLSAGIYTYQINGNSLSSGVYFYKIIAGNFTDTKKMVLVK